MEDFQYLLSLGELEVLGEEVVELDDALKLDSSSLELLRKALLGAHDFAGCAWLRLDLNLGGHVAPQVLELHVVVVLDVVPRHIVHLGVVVVALPLLLALALPFLCLRESCLVLTVSMFLHANLILRVVVV